MHIKRKGYVCFTFVHNQGDRVLSTSNKNLKGFGGEGGVFFHTPVSDTVGTSKWCG